MAIPCSLYPGLPGIQIPAKFFKSWAVWQTKKDSVPAESRTIPQGATFNNINANMRPPFKAG